MYYRFYLWIIFIGFFMYHSLLTRDHVGWSSIHLWLDFVKNTDNVLVYEDDHKKKVAQPCHDDLLGFNCSKKMLHSLFPKWKTLHIYLYNRSWKKAILGQILRETGNKYWHFIYTIPPFELATDGFVITFIVCRSFCMAASCI